MVISFKVTLKKLLLIGDAYKPSLIRIKHDSIFLDTTGGIYKHLFE